jgi:hypothetical protein
VSSTSSMPSSFPQTPDPPSQVRSAERGPGLAGSPPLVWADESSSTSGQPEAAA